MERSDTEPRRIGLSSASFVASLRTNAGTGSRCMNLSYGYYIRRQQPARLLHSAQPELPHAGDVRPQSGSICLVVIIVIIIH
ncbi:MAG: hypothetical protein BMS9Abin37_2813 [Acidobacteriota bacterium]|nr:MAG: hypothetical protein BMS9Abin37_2813 [Acidobacteriota bacterium]